MSRYSAQSFIKDRINLIDNNRFYTLFEEARHLLMDDQRRELIKLLDSAEIDYLDHMPRINANLFQRSSRRMYDIPSNEKASEVIIDADCVNGKSAPKLIEKEPVKLDADIAGELN